MSSSDIIEEQHRIQRDLVELPKFASSIIPRTDNRCSGVMPLTKRDLDSGLRAARHDRHMPRLSIEKPPVYPVYNMSGVQSVF